MNAFFFTVSRIFAVMKSMNAIIFLPLLCYIVRNDCSLTKGKPSWRESYVSFKLSGEIVGPLREDFSMFGQLLLNN